jgi:hypothetical protein
VASALAVDSGSHFQLDFRVPQTDWHASDSITGEATLSYLGSGSVTVSGSEFILFEFDEVGGNRRVVPVSDAVCAVGELDAVHPITSQITKSGGWLPNDPNAAFLQSFFANQAVRLPAGDWTITAIASFSEGDCTVLAQTALPSITLRASVVVHVTA